MNENPILEQLKREALYAQRSFSTELLYQTYGKAQMARQLEVLTQSEFMYWWRYLRCARIYLSGRTEKEDRLHRRPKHGAHQKQIKYLCIHKLLPLPLQTDNLRYIPETIMYNFF